MISLKKKLFKALVILENGCSATYYLNAENTTKAIEHCGSKGYLITPDCEGPNGVVKGLVECHDMHLSFYERLFPLTSFGNHGGALKR